MVSRMNTQTGSSSSEVPLSRSALIRSVRPTLRAAATSERERAEFAYALVREVYDYVVHDLDAPWEDTPERARLGKIVNAALPR